MATDNTNLSEQLFKAQLNYPETSSLIQRTDNGNNSNCALFDTEDCSNWYRVIHRLSWYWHGVPWLELDEVLARIAVSKKRRSHEQWLDSVIGYQSGNWTYEFITQSAKWQQQADSIAKDPDIENDEQKRAKCHKHWLIASLFAGLASYPYYRNDDLAVQAQVFANRYYQEAMNYSPYLIKDVEFTVEDKTIKGILHTPLKKTDEVKAFPIVFFCLGLEHLQTNFYHYFINYLAPLGVGLLVIDPPGVGYSKSFNLSQNTSKIHQAVLEQIHTVPLIDHTKVILLGYRWGANIATRLAYLMPNKIKGLINIAPIIHQLFVDEKLQTKMPVMYKDMIASRLGLNVISNQQLAAELKFYSLKTQNIIGRACSVPIFNIVFEGDSLGPESEAKLLTSAKKSTVFLIKQGSLKENFKSASAQSAKWIKALIS